MASTKSATLFIVLSIIAFTAAAVPAGRPPKRRAECCTKVQFTGYSRFVSTIGAPDQNIFPVVPGEVNPPYRNGFGATFNGAFTSGPSPSSPRVGNYSGTFHVVSGNRMAYQISQILFSHPPAPGYQRYRGKIEFQGDLDLLGNLTTYAVVGGTETFEGATGTVTETNSDGVNFKEQFNLTLRTPCV